MKKNIPQMIHKSAFSLAEALITLLIVCIITLASIPVITKKHRNKFNGNEKLSTGKYFCYLDASGKHNFVSDIDGVETNGTSENDYCEFTPPVNAKDFIIMVSGGGAGGGLGYNYLDRQMFQSSDTYTIPEDGTYDLLVVGGGGAGKTGDNDGEYSGGSGGWELKTAELRQGDVLSIQVGEGGKLGSCTEFEKPVWDYHTEMVVSDLLHGNFKEIPIYEMSYKKEKKCFGSTNGAASSITTDSMQVLASGGYANNTGELLCFGWDTFDACGGEPNGRDGGFLDGTVAPSVPKKYLPDNMKPIPGSGAATIGFWNDDAVAKILNGNGADGIAIVASNNNYCGEGGAAGDISTVGVYTLKNEQIRIKIGKGGKGATDKEHPATNGEMSSFGNLIKAMGGKAGSSTRNCVYSDDKKTVYGYNGEASSFVKKPDSVGACGGYLKCKTADMNGQSMIYTSAADGMNALSFGSGGGGGGLSLNSANILGKGGDGASGFVYIEW